MSIVTTTAWARAKRMLLRALTAVMLLALSTPVRGEFTLADVIENVRLNEELYCDIEVGMHSTYDIGNRAPTDGSMGNEVIRKELPT